MWLNMKQVKNLALFLLLLLHFCPFLVSTVESQGNTSRGIMERLSFGKVWYAYIKANMFDLLAHTFRTKEQHSNTLFLTLQGAATQMDILKISRYPCQNLNISFDRSIFHDGKNRKGFSQTELDVLTKSKLCGSISRTYGIIAPSVIREERIPKDLAWLLKVDPSFFTHQNKDKDLTWIYQIHANQHFIINVTVVSLESRLYPPCLTTRVLIEEFYNIDRQGARPLGEFCPNSPPQSFYSTGNNVIINVHTWGIYQHFFMTNVYFNQWIGKVSFAYEILDNDLSSDPWIKKRLPMDKYDYVDSFKPTQQYHKLSHSVNLTGNSRSKISHLEEIPHLFRIFESKGEILYIFHFQSHLGATLAVKEGSLACTKTQATLVAYEGPVVDITRVDFLLVRLQEWNCGHKLNAANRKAELQGRIGDMTILFLVEKTGTLHFYSLTLKVVYREIHVDPSYALLETLRLETGGSSVEFEQKSTFFYTIDIESQTTGFIKIFFDHLSFRGYMDQSCTYGGVYIVNYYTNDGQYIGSLCSRKSAARFQSLYERHGLTLNDRLIIYIKQYKLLFLAQVKLRFYLDQCFGFVNPQLHSMPYGQYSTDHKKQVAVIMESKFYSHGSNSYYRWYEAPASMGIKLNTSNLICFKLHYVYFEHIYLDEMVVIPNTMVNKVVVGIGHVGNDRPSLFSMAFWNMEEELKHFDNCLANAFRFFPDNKNNEPYVLLRMPEEESWTTLAFTAKFALDKTCLLFGGTFHIREQKEDTYSQCFSEVGGYLDDADHPIIPQGVCGSILVNLHRQKFNNRISFQRPFFHDRCCHLHMLTMPTTIPCVRNVIGYRNKNAVRVFSHAQDLHVWSNHVNSSEVFTWRTSCTRDSIYNAVSDSNILSLVTTCIDLLFQQYTTCDVKIHHRMSLLPVVATNGTVTSPYQICDGDTCYVLSRLTPTPISWEDAQLQCEQMNGSLVSVNSNTEWRLLTAHNLVLDRNAKIKQFYIGYRTVSNLFTITACTASGF